MPRFLHLADVHLGFDRYDSKERTKDFYLAFEDALRKYALEAQVDFVIIAGDLFEHRIIQPNILNQAKLCFQLLKEAQIPVIAIEGNHDNRPYGTVTNWLKYLANDELVILLEPDRDEAGGMVYEMWNGEAGGYIDLDCGVRVLGSRWYGASAPRAIERLAEAMQQLPPSPGHTVMLFHQGLEGQIARYQGAMRYIDLLPLKEAGVDYLALGHIHKSYTEQGWIFNPGSTEANSVEEANYDRGVYLVELSDQGIDAQLKTDYYQRPWVRLKLKARGQESTEEIEQSAIALVQSAIQSGQLNPEIQPMVELRIEGQVGFDRLDLDVRTLQQNLKQLSQALIFLLKYEADSVEYASPIAEDASRLQIEQEVFTDLLAGHNHYKSRANELAKGLIGLKEMQLEARPENELYQFVEELLGSTVG
ncbi:metallophosphoesterase family protein [Leptolyngbya sp. NIES-2104]|uniref:metallophosphoesterase family protein n=1 Tax=Leptolyngbya sp. NIES-2104 TaxID=1552121 RepID=UPI0006EC9902|nr:DNA repair exonuclease [Leptolyngbya sp. NIES-2104]GAP97372.1 exonuclease SbcD [Leptolyngbya sp. NIES-2104]